MEELMVRNILSEIKKGVNPISDKERSNLLCSDADDVVPCFKTVKPELGRFGYDMSNVMTDEQLIFGKYIVGILDEKLRYQRKIMKQLLNLFTYAGIDADVIDWGIKLFSSFRLDHKGIHTRQAVAYNSAGEACTKAFSLYEKITTKAALCALKRIKNRTLNAAYDSKGRVDLYKTTVGDSTKDLVTYYYNTGSIALLHSINSANIKVVNSQVQIVDVKAAQKELVDYITTTYRYNVEDIKAVINEILCRLKKKENVSELKYISDSKHKESNGVLMAPSYQVLEDFLKLL